MLITPEQRREHFDRIVVTWQDRATKRLDRAAQSTRGLHQVDNQAEVTDLLKSLERHTTDCFYASFLHITDHTPKREYRRVVESLLNTEMEHSLQQQEEKLMNKINTLEAQDTNEDLVALEHCQSALDRLARQVKTGRFPNPNQHIRKMQGSTSLPPIYWRGADIIVNDEPLPAYRGSKTVVIISHAGPISLLLRRFVKLCSPVLNYSSKYEFFGEIADYLNNRLDEQAHPTRQQALLWAVIGAQEILSEWKRRACGAPPPEFYEEFV